MIVTVNAPRRRRRRAPGSACAPCCGSWAGSGSSAAATRGLRRLHDPPRRRAGAFLPRPGLPGRRRTVTTARGSGARARPGRRAPPPGAGGVPGGPGLPVRLLHPRHGDGPPRPSTRASAGTSPPPSRATCAGAPATARSATRSPEPPGSRRRPARRSGAACRPGRAGGGHRHRPLHPRRRGGRRPAPAGAALAPRPCPQSCASRPPTPWRCRVSRCSPMPTCRPAVLDGTPSHPPTDDAADTRVLDSTVRFVGQRVAAVVAESEARRRRPCVRSPSSTSRCRPCSTRRTPCARTRPWSMAPTTAAATTRRRSTRTRTSPPRFTRDRRRGGGLAEADLVHEGTYVSQRVQHAHLETHGAVAGSTPRAASSSAPAPRCRSSPATPCAPCSTCRPTGCGCCAAGSAAALAASRRC